MTDLKSDSFERSRRRAQALSTWNDGGGADENGTVQTASIEPLPDALPLTNSELVQLQVRVIALENLLAVLLAEATDYQLEVARDMAACILPSPGHTPHSLTIHASARMINLVKRAAHLREPRHGDCPDTAQEPP